MFGMDLFFKSAAAGMKIAQIGLESMLKMMELFAGFSGQTKKPTAKEGPVMKKTTDTPQPPPVAKAPTEIFEKTKATSKIKKEPLSKKVMVPSESSPVPASLPKTIPFKSERKKEKKPVSPQKSSPSKKMSSTAIDEVQAFIALQKQGASAKDVMKATGFKKKKVQDILYKLKKRGILKSEKGLYIKM